MKKQILIKIFLNVILIVSILFCLTFALMYIRGTFFIIKELNSSNISSFTQDVYIHNLPLNIAYTILFFLNLIADVIIFIFLNFKDASYLTSSLFKKWNDGKAQREIEQKEKKQAKLQAEIAEKQAMLDEIKKE